MLNEKESIFSFIFLLFECIYEIKQISVNVMEKYFSSSLVVWLNKHGVYQMGYWDLRLRISKKKRTEATNL